MLNADTLSITVLLNRLVNNAVYFDYNTMSCIVCDMQAELVA